MRIICHTLFDITKTGVNFRNRYDVKSDIDLLKHRNQQSNFETILQVVGMRGQPENISEVQRISASLGELKKYNFGYLYSSKYLKKIKSVAIWRFEFSVDRSSVFDNGVTELGYLLADCSGVPMIVNLDESIKLSNHLEIGDENRNIHFMITMENEQEN